MGVIREMAAGITGRCWHCMKKLTAKESILYHGLCTECWRLRGGD